MKDQDPSMMVGGANTPGSMVDPGSIKMEPNNMKEEVGNMEAVVKREDDGGMVVKPDPHQNGQADMPTIGHAGGANTPLTGLPSTPSQQQPLPGGGGPPPQHNGQNVTPGPPNGDASLPLQRGNLMDTNMPPNVMRPGPPQHPPHGPPASGPPIPHMDSHFMQQQQQSQIFVFSTTLANEGAKAVQSGHYKSILDFHIDNPRTKQFIQKHQIKLQPGANRTPMSMFSANMRPDAPLMSKTSQGMIGPSPGPDSMASVAQWVQQQNANLQQHVGPTFSPPPVSLHDPGTFSPPPITTSNFPAGGGAENWVGPQGPNTCPTSPHEFGMMGGPGPGGFPNIPGQCPVSMQQTLSQNKIPNENLTPEQLQRREEQLAKMRKIQQLLFPEQQGGAGMPGGPGGMMPMGPGGPGAPANMHPAMMSQANMTSQPNMMTSQPSMTSQPGMLGSPGSMMGMNNSTMGPGGPFIPGMPPPNWENMTPAQREWFKLQQEFYTDKRRKQAMQHMQHMQQMPPGPGPPGPGGMPQGPPGPPGPGQPPSYFSSLQRRQGPPMSGPMSPTSANFNGPIPSPHLRGPSPAPGDNFMMFPGGPRRPGPGNMNFPGGGPGPNFDPLVLDPNMPSGPGGMFPFKDDMIRGKMPMIHRAGNPEQFNPADILPGPGTPNSSGPTKPPPSYAQAQKRKRSGDDMDDPYKKLQPAPSPQQFSYLNQFEGQELTITKQLNLAYQDEGGSPSNNNNNMNSQQSAQQQPPQQPGCQPPPLKQQNSRQGPGSVEAHAVPSPMPPTSSAPIPCTTSMAVSSVSSPLPASRPSSRPSSAQALLLCQPHTPQPQQPLTPVSSSNSQRLSHYDTGNNSIQQPPLSRASSQPSHIPPSTSSTTGPTGPTTPTSTKNSMANITSASLANLAKGVEHLSNQMQQNMMQGGPFHNIQVQGQMADVDGSPENPPSALSASGGAGMVGGPGSIGPPTSSSQASPHHAGSSQPGPGPSVNNTFVNATMSIGQLNIQSVNPGGGGGPGPGPGGYNASMQVQQMNNEQMAPQMGSMGGSGPSGPHQPPMSVPCSVPPCSMPGSAPCNSVNCSMPGGGIPPPHRPPMDHYMPGMRPGAPMQGAGAMHPMSSGPAGFPGGPPSPGMVNSPSFRQSSSNPLGNANVQIQAKAPNTIQYLPANPPTSQPCGPGMGPVRPIKEMEMMDPTCYPMDGRTSAPKMGHMGGPAYGPGGDVMMGGGPGQMPMAAHGPMGPGSGHRMSMAQSQSQGMGMHQQSMMMQQQQQQPNNAMSSQQMASMQYGSPPGAMHPGHPRGPSPAMQEMLQMQSQHMQSMQQGGGPPIMGPGGGMRPEMMGHGGPHGPGASHGPAPGPNQMSGYQAQFQQIQQQLYAQGRPRGAQMNPNGMPPGAHMGGPQPGSMPPGGHMVGPQPGGMPPGGHMMGGPQQEMMGGHMGGMGHGPGMLSPGPRGPGGPGQMVPMGGMGGPGMGPGMNMMPSMP